MKACSGLLKTKAVKMTFARTENRGVADTNASFHLADITNKNFYNLNKKKMNTI